MMLEELNGAQKSFGKYKIIHISHHAQKYYTLISVFASHMNKS